MSALAPVPGASALSPGTAVESGRRTARTGATPIAAIPLQSSRWLLGFVFLEIACQVALLFPSLAPARVVIRSAAFVASLLLAIFLPGPRDDHPSRGVGIVALGIVALSIFHPSTNTILAGFATLGLYAAILGPLFWVPRIRIDMATVRRMLFVFWAFETASAALGALQVYFPGQFQPALSTVLGGGDNDSYARSLQITLANGEHVFRPMGLTDVPGGAGGGAVYGVLIGVGFLLDRPTFRFRMALLAGMLVSCFTLYLCQVRILMLMLVIGLLAMTAPFIAQRKIGRIVAVALPVTAAALVSFALAVAIGGDAVTSRLSTLVDDNPSNVYYSNRGIFLEHTFNVLLPEYPLGAGLARYGMILSYFGDRFNPASPPIWAEIQWTAWLLDGGIAMIVLYAVAFVLAFRESLRIAVRQLVASDAQLGIWAAVIVGYTVSVVATTFGSCPFASTSGIDFWLLNALVFAASRQIGGPEYAR